MVDNGCGFIADGSDGGHCRQIAPWFRGVKFPAIPTEYDDALSYYEALQKMYYAVNQAIDCLNGRMDNFQDTANEYTDEKIAGLKTYVDQQDKGADEKFTTMYNEIVQANLELVIKVNQLYEAWTRYQGIVDGRIENIYQALRQYVEELWVNVKPPIYVVNPVNGQMSTLQVALDDMWRNWNYGGITAGEYDRLLISAIRYDNQMISAWVYDNRARQLPFFFDRIYGAMIDPFDGEWSSVVDVVYKLAALHMEGISAEAYDAIEITAEEYDGKNISAYDYDWKGKQLLTA